MPRHRWTDTREREYSQIQQSHRRHGARADTAEEIADRTVNKARARAGVGAWSPAIPPRIALRWSGAAPTGARRDRAGRRPRAFSHRGGGRPA